MSYNRNLSPGSRRIQNPGRVSDTLADSYYTQRHNSYTSPRASVGVIPISTQTFVNVPPPASATRPVDRFDSYSGRPRRTSLLDNQRSTAPSVTQLPTRSRPTVVQNDIRPTSPVKPSSTRDRDYYITPASSKEPRKSEHKKLYSVDDGSAKLVADVDIPATSERHHKRRESGGYKGLAVGAEKDRGRRAYHLNGHSRGRDKSIDDEDAYSYTDAAGMYRDTEPIRRDARPRRGSMDRGGASRERPVSMLDPAYDPRASIKDIGPPPSTRGWDKLNDGVGRTRSVRDPPPRHVAQSPTRGRLGDPRDPYYVPPRTTSREGRSAAIHHDRPVERYDQYETYDREPRRHERRNSVTRQKDPSVERRGFGIRGDSRDRYGRGSDENFERQKYRDSGYAEPHRRDTVPEMSHHDVQRLDQERKDRELAARLQAEERERQYEREREQQRRRDDDRPYDRDYERERERPRDREAERETERERERQRMMEREPERDRDRGERHHQRRETYDRKDAATKDSSESGGKPGLAQAAAGGLAGAAAAFGINKVLNKDKGDDRDSERERERDAERQREKEREREREREREWEVERQREKERERERERETDRRYDEPRREDRERERKPRGPESYSDESGPFDRTERDRPRDQDRGLGFAFEQPPAIPKTAPLPERHRESEAERMQERDFEREHDDVRKPADMPKSNIDADEDYRRRMEQVQRELGRAPAEDRASNDSDPDRERRRREREQRQREREVQRDDGDFREPKLDAGIGLTSFNEQPPPPALRRSFDNESVSTVPSSAPGLRRRPSILDAPMTGEPAQIIDNSMSERRENRVRIVDPPTEEEDKRPKGILKKPTQKFPEDPNAVREGVAPLKDATKKGIPPGARWTKIDRRLVNPEALEEFKERFEERVDCVIVLRVLTKEEIQKLADRTRELRDERYEEDRAERKARRRERRAKDEYSDVDSEDEYAERAPKMLEAPSSAGAPSEADFIRENNRRREREREGEQQYNMSGGLGRRD